MKITIEYLAGFTDGEGSLGLCGYGPRITWGQNKDAVLFAIKDWLADQGIPSNVNVIAPKPPRRPNQITMLWIARKDMCERVARMLLPYLIVKKEDCERLISWLENHPYVVNTVPLDLDMVRELASQGKTKEEMARFFDCSQGKVAKFCKEHGIDYRRKIVAMTEEQRQIRSRKKRYSGKCMDCGNPIQFDSKRCRDCDRVKRVGPNGRGLPDGVWSLKHPCCIDCGTKEKRHVAFGRCSDCREAYRSQNRVPRRKASYQESDQERLLGDL